MGSRSKVKDVFRMIEMWICSQNFILVRSFCAAKGGATAGEIRDDNIYMRYENAFVSLNIYDKVGRLLSSKQPLRKNDGSNEKLESNYQYNSLGHLIYSKSPDEGEAWFKYRKDDQKCLENFS